MLPAPQNAMEKKKQTEYYRHLVKETFNVVDIQRTGTVDKKEISQIMRYLLQFPSEAQIRDHVIEILEGDEPCDYVKYDKFEAYMIEKLFDNEFEPNYAEHLMAAFKVLDPENKGYIAKDIMTQLTTTQGIPFREREIQSFLTAATDKTGDKIYYEEYISKLMEEEDRQKESLMRDYEAFKVPANQ